MNTNNNMLMTSDLHSNTQSIERVPPLDSLLTYQNKDLIDRYVADYGLSRPFAKRQLQELLKYFWISSKGRPLGIKIGMYPEMSCIDWMWHTFLLFSKEYEQFCYQYFGRYIYHQPETDREFKLSTHEMHMKNLETFLNFVYDHLGAKTLNYWFKPAHSKIIQNYEERHKIPLNTK